MAEIAWQITVFLAPGPGPTGPRPRKKNFWDIFFCPNGRKKNFGPNGWKAAELLDRLFTTEWQSDRVTESQSHATSTPYTGGWNFFMPIFNKLPYLLRSQGDKLRQCNRSRSPNWLISSLEITMLSVWNTSVYPPASEASRGVYWKWA